MLYDSQFKSIDYFRLNSFKVMVTDDLSLTSSFLVSWSIQSNDSEIHELWQENTRNIYT